MYWMTDYLSSHFVIEWYNSGLKKWLTCIDWLIASGVAVCVTGILLDWSWFTWLYWLTDYLSSHFVIEWYNSGLKKWLTCIDWLIASGVAVCVTGILLDWSWFTWLYWLTDYLSSHFVIEWYNSGRKKWLTCIDWLIASGVAVCVTGILLDWSWFTCIDWLITSAVALW